MASGVFGVPITVDTLRDTGRYQEPITQRDVADFAMNSMNDGRDINAQQFVDNLKDSYGNGSSTKCLIYNATGTTLSFAAYQDWHGHIYNTPYPSEILSGQWGAFLHVQPGTHLAGSAGAAVYRTKILSSNDSSCDWLFCWSIPVIGDNRVYTEIGKKDCFIDHWDDIYHSKLENSSRTCTATPYEGYVSQTDIGEGTTVNARAVFKLA